MNNGLEPTPPAEAVEWYLSARSSDLSKKSLQNQQYRLSQFVKFCEEQGIDDMTVFTSRDIQRYRMWRSKDVKPVTLNGELQTFRVFLGFCAKIDAVEQGMREKVHIPNLDPADEARSRYLSTERAEELIEYLERFRFASREHVIIVLLWHTGMRLGSLRSLDVGDFDAEAQCLDLRHRPEKGTGLKNKARAERSIAVGDHYCGVLQAYIKHNRHNVTDDYGRRPLITSQHGRFSDGGVRETVYRLTQPCEFGECPHDEDPQTCEYRQHSQRAGCPSSHSPHDIRRGAITRQLREGIPPEVVTDRSDVSKEILDKHYDERSQREKMEIRREFLEGI